MEQNDSQNADCHRPVDLCKADSPPVGDENAQKGRDRHGCSDKYTGIRYTNIDNLPAEVAQGKYAGSDAEIPMVLHEEFHEELISFFHSAVFGQSGNPGLIDPFYKEIRNRDKVADSGKPAKHLTEFFHDSFSLYTLTLHPGVR